MSEKEQDPLIPAQAGGAESNTESVAELASEEEAVAFFQTVKERLLDVNHWHQTAGPLSAQFWLTDSTGKEKTGPPKEGDYFKIDIPGPGPKTGEGYDWVRVEKTEAAEKDGHQMAAIRVRPASKPDNANKDVAHFFSEEATSSFIVRREGSKVIASVHGRNETPNTDATRLIDKARNAFLASGAAAGISKLQWKSLAEGLVKKEV